MKRPRRIDLATSGNDVRGGGQREGKVFRALISVERAVLLTGAALACYLISASFMSASAWGASGARWLAGLQGIIGLLLALGLGRHYLRASKLFEERPRTGLLDLAEYRKTSIRQDQNRLILDEAVELSLSSFQDDYGISSPRLAALLEKSGPGSQEFLSTLADFVYLRNHLKVTFGSQEAARRWLHCTNPYLHPATPADLLEKGEIDKVEAALEALDSGVFV